MLHDGTESSSIDFRLRFCTLRLVWGSCDIDVLRCFDGTVACAASDSSGINCLSSKVVAVAHKDAAASDALPAIFACDRRFITLAPCEVDVNAVFCGNRRVLNRTYIVT